jgi:protein ImuB
MKFERLALPAPVIAIRLRGGRAQALQMASANLPFKASGRGQQGTSIAPLLERLAARIGDGFVHGVTAVAEHRPQYAWSAVQPLSQAMRQTTGARIPPCAAVPTPWDDADAAPQLAGMRRTGSLLLRRPLWMLAEPLALASERNMPHYQGPLRLKEGPERIESGWWDDNGIARDYFVAVNAHGVHLWIYRSRHEDADWYLHGIFG